jgi:methylglutaconyl-CoA hydratase
MIVPRILRRAARLNAKALNSVRSLQVQAGVNAEKEAFLAPVESHPGVWGLALNRPKSKNAISVKLLEVWFGYKLYIPHTSYLTGASSNSENVWRP